MDLNKKIPKENLQGILLMIIIAFIGYFFVKAFYDSRKQAEVLKSIKIEKYVPPKIPDCEVKGLSDDFFKKSISFHTVDKNNSTFDSYYFLKKNDNSWLLRVIKVGLLLGDVKVNVVEDNEVLSIQYCNDQFMKGQYYEYIKKDNMFLSYNKQGEIIEYGKKIKNQP